MTYRVEYNGGDIEVTTLDAALDNAKHAIASDVGPISGWTVEHDETINDWFIQGVVHGKVVGSTAVVSGPEPVMTPSEAPEYHRGPEYPRGTVYSQGAVYRQDDTAPGEQYRPRHPSESTGGGEEWVRTITFAGVTPAEVFGKATTWLAGRPDAVTVRDVGWQTAAQEEAFQLRIHYHGETP